MITIQTAADIWAAYREIATGTKLLADMHEARTKPFGITDKHAPTLKDAFGKERHLELGIPSGDSGHRILDVAPELAESIIRSHIARKKIELTEANERARIELTMPE